MAAKEHENEQLTGNIEVLEKKKEVLYATDWESSVEKLKGQ